MFFMFGKVEVNGFGVDLLFKYFKDEVFGLLIKNIKWNFIKFLVNVEGEVIKCYVLMVKFVDIEEDIVVFLPAA